MANIVKRKRGAYEGRSEPSEWKMVQRVKNINLENEVKTAGRERFREVKDLQQLKRSR